MSCQIISVAKIVDTEAIRRCLFPTDDKTGSDSWLQQCHISVSPVGDVIALGKERRLVILTSRLDSTSESQFNIAFAGIIHEVDNIRAVSCLPIVTPDWTCILLGFDSGYVRVYMETSELLYEEQFHSECITNIKCQSQHNPRPDISIDLHSEEIHVQYQSNVCVIAGSQLFQYLRKCRAQLARVQAQSELLDIARPAMNIRKWGFEDQSIVNDIAVVGLTNSNSFDHLLTASTSGGFKCRVRSAPPLSTLVLAAGSKPFLGFHYAVEGITLPVFSDVAKVVANKLKSALPSWLTGPRPQVEMRPSIAVQPTDQMGCRFGLCDLQRTANSIILSPNHKLAALSDSLGRVILIDTTKGIALRVLKGYRDSQCSFVQVPDDRRSKHRVGDMVAHFLVIYAPKKGTVEIFTTQQCSKIATFSAMKYSRLIYINYGLMGYSKLAKSKYVCQFTTVFIDNDGQIKEIMIPFHFSLTEKNNKRARDIHLYKKLRELVKTDTFDENTLLTEALKTTEELKTIEIKSQLIQFLSTTKNIPLQVLLNCAKYLANNLQEEDSNELINSLKVKVLNIVSIIKFYLYLLNESSQCDVKHNNANPNEITSNILKLGSKEIKNLEKIMNLNIMSDNKKQQELKVKFSEQESYCISEFLSVFDLSCESNIKLLPRQDEAVLYNVSEAFFHEYIVKLKDYKYFQEEVEKSKIYRKDLIFLLINYWVNRKLSDDLNLKTEMDHLATLLYILVRMSEDIYNDNSVEAFWYEMRECLTVSNRPFSALTAAMSCKYVAYKIEKEKDMDNTSLPLDDDIEIWSEENVEWALLIGKLEDVALLNILTTNDPKLDENCSLPKLPHEKVDVSLKLILEKKGSVSEIVARWLTLSGIDPEYIVINDKINKPQNCKTSGETSASGEEEKLLFPEVKIRFVQRTQMFQHFNMIRTQWPYSLEASMILANMSWEYALEWKKNILKLEHLEACISCLKNIPNYHIKLGLFHFVWKTHLKVLFESITKLMNKVGKLPKAKLCQQDTGFSDIELSKFIKICTNFLDTLTDIAREMYVIPKVDLHFEHLWENGGQPLVELAVQQTNLNYDLLLLHYQLSLVFSMFCTFSLKAIKPVDNLFDVEIIDVLFCDFQEKPNVDFNKKHSKLTKSRLEFLKKVISSSVEAITVKDSNIYVKDHVYWNAKCILLGRIWDVDLDILRQQQILQLFVHGYDSIAYDLLGIVTDRQKIFGKELLELAGKRMSKYLASCTELGFYLSALTPPVTNYIQRLNKDWCAESSLKQIMELTAVSISHINEDEYEHRLATYLLEGVDYLIKYESESNP